MSSTHHHIEGDGHRLVVQSRPAPTPTGSERPLVRAWRRIEYAILMSLSVAGLVLYVLVNMPPL